MTVPEPVEVRDAWRQALEVYLARKERIRTLRLELAAVRLVAKERQHVARLARSSTPNRTTEAP